MSNIKHKSIKLQYDCVHYNYVEDNFDTVLFWKSISFILLINTQHLFN